MKEKILMLIVGILIGAIITTGVFLVINNNSDTGTPDMSDKAEGGRIFDANNIPEGMENMVRSGGNTIDSTNTSI